MGEGETGPPACGLRAEPLEQPLEMFVADAMGLQPRNGLGQILERTAVRPRGVSQYVSHKRIGGIGGIGDFARMLGRPFAQHKCQGHDLAPAV